MARGAVKLCFVLFWFEDGRDLSTVTSREKRASREEEEED